MPTLTARKREILKFIVSEHVQTASPVGSNTVARSTNVNASPATIRNEMVALEEEGLIRRPHVSSGGVPSDRGYRHFVGSLDPEMILRPAVAAQGDQDFPGVHAYVEEWVDSSSEILAGLMDTLAFTTMPRTAPAPGAGGRPTAERAGSIRRSAFVHTSCRSMGTRWLWTPQT